MFNKEELHIKEDFERKLIDIRQHLHKYPELSFQEYRTCEYIATILEEWDIPFNRIGDTGIVVDIIGEKGEGPHIGIRADIDALPIQEQTQLSFSSVNQGIMHACGHDGHTTILLGTVYQLHKLKSKLSGRVRCIFQPGEESDGAAQQLIDLGVLEAPPVDGMLALHLWPHLPHGTIGVRYGAITASCDDFIIEIEGKGGHSARPHQAIDAITISSQILQALHTLVTKSSSPVEPVVVHVGKIHGGTASNIVADHVVLEGTTRAVTCESRKRLKTQLIDLCENLAKSFGGKARVQYKDGHPPVINSEWMTRAVEESAIEFFGDQKLVHLKEPSMGADDFGAFAEKVPSTYFRLGTAQADQQVFDLHHPQFEFHDSVISIGVQLFTFVVFSRLQKGVEKTW
ncbi:amidohydrolase [Bacillus sp. FJAT-29790]|uniref:M20 metallopeptidase family protein n=1 Tax=Bacillus sp. FJAT-29790 TaxID=1895002 RepID=UPI001C250212|nr:M20 family metallopeptidase [Bacillus sp. FJAT-29790]MBU8878486.1 amidohydrolase [Bacillus sp. FJAT-29790]